MTANVPSLLLFIMSTDLSKHAWHYLPNGGKDDGTAVACCEDHTGLLVCGLQRVSGLQPRSQWIRYKSTCSSIISSLPHQLISWSNLYSPCCHRWRWCKFNCIFCASLLFSFLKWSWFVFRLMHFVFTCWLTHNVSFCSLIKADVICFNTIPFVHRT